jgi:hypothetical protein
MDRDTGQPSNEEISRDNLGPKIIGLPYDVRRRFRVGAKGRLGD